VPLSFLSRPNWKKARAQVELELLEKDELSWLVEAILVILMWVGFALCDSVLILWLRPKTFWNMENLRD